MQRLLRNSAWLLVLTACLVWSSGAYADTLSWTITGADETGSGTMTATNEGGGVYLVTGMTGNIAVNGTSETITGFTPFTGTWTPGATETVFSGESGLDYTYDDIVDVGTNPQLDTAGLVFSLSGFSQLINVCSGDNRVASAPDLALGLTTTRQAASATPSLSRRWLPLSHRQSACWRWDCWGSWSFVADAAGKRTKLPGNGQPLHLARRVAADTQ